MIILLIAVLLLTALGLTLVAIRRAPKGHEDRTGFHHEW